MLTALTLTFGLAFTDHVGLDGDYNEINPNVELSYDRFSLGVYKNSFGDPSFYVGYTVYQGWMDVDVGFVTGYSREVMPYIKLEKQIADNVSLFAIPAWSGNSGSNVGISVGINFTWAALGQ